MSEALTETRPGTRSLSPIRWIRIDAAMSAASGLLLAAASPALDGPLGAPIAFLVPLGAFLLAYAAALAGLARAGAPSTGVKAVIAGNALWVVASVVAVLTDVLTLTTAGTVIAIVQAAAVALVADMQLVALRAAARGR
jgi:hypothetical protein